MGGELGRVSPAPRLLGKGRPKAGVRAEHPPDLCGDVLWEES